MAISKFETVCGGRFFRRGPFLVWSAPIAGKSKAGQMWGLSLQNGRIVEVAVNSGQGTRWYRVGQEVGRGEVERWLNRCSSIPGL